MPPAPLNVFVPLKLYVPELALSETPVLVSDVVTLPLKLIVALLVPATVTAVPALDWEIVVPQVMLPLPPLTLNVAPLAPVSEPAVAPHVPETPVNDTPFVPPVEVTFANVPVTVPVLSARAETAETFTVPWIVSVPNVVPLMPVVAPV